MGKLIISMAIFNSYFDITRGYTSEVNLYTFNLRYLRILNLVDLSVRSPPGHVEDLRNQLGLSLRTTDLVEFVHQGYIISIIMYVCMYVCMYVFMYVCIYICI